MKLRSWLVPVCLLASVYLFTSCEPDPEVDTQKYLEATWTLNSDGHVLKGGTDKTSDYSGLTITFKGDGTYTTANAGKLFYPSGTWQWTGTEPTQIVIDGDLPIEILAIEQTTLHLQFQLDIDHVNTDGKTTAMVGDYEIFFKN